MSASARLLSLTPTVFFVRRDVLRQRALLALECDEDVSAQLRVRTATLDETIFLGRLTAGPSQVEVYLPDLTEPTTLHLTLLAGGRAPHELDVDWRPQRHWSVYMIDFSHHDLGYTDLPSRVYEEQGGFLAQVLD